MKQILLIQIIIGLFVGCVDKKTCHDNGRLISLTCKIKNNELFWKVENHSSIKFVIPYIQPISDLKVINAYQKTTSNIRFIPAG